MKVIVRIQEGKFFDGRKAIRPAFGEVIDLPDHLAKRELKAKTVLPFEHTEVKSKPKTKKTRKKTKASTAKKKTKKTKKAAKKTPVG